MSELISFVIPGYNEGERIIRTLEKLEAFCEVHFPAFEIIFVDDGSSDDTLERMRAYSSGSTIKTLQCRNNCGKGHAVRLGMMAAAGQYRFFTDADLPYEPGCFLEGLKKLKSGTCQIVIGNRHLPESADLAGLSLMRKISSLIFNLIVNILFPIRIMDTQCACKGFTARSAEAVFSRASINGFVFDAELLVLAFRLGFVVEKVPVTLINAGESKIRLGRDPFLMFWDLLKLRFKMGIEEDRRDRAE